MSTVSKYARKLLDVLLFVGYTNKTSIQKILSLFSANFNSRARLHRKCPREFIIKKFFYAATRSDGLFKVQSLIVTKFYYTLEKLGSFFYVFNYIMAKKMVPAQKTTVAVTCMCGLNMEQISLYTIIPFHFTGHLKYAISNKIYDFVFCPNSVIGTFLAVCCVHT